MNSQIKCEILQVDGAGNVRDLGGYFGTDGKKVRPRRFIRAAALNEITPKGEKDLEALGVDCVVDLRSTMEVQNFPDTVAENEAIHYVHIPLLDYIQSNINTGELDGFPASMEEMYRGLLDKSGESFARLFRVFAGEARTVLFHCTAGKDRTGVTAMLLLHLAGVSREVIVEDYAYTRLLMPPNVVAPGLPAYLFDADPATMESTVDYLEKTYGGAAGYLSAIGVSVEEQQVIRNKLLG